MRSLLRMKLPILGCATLLALYGWAANPAGTYKSASGKSFPWSVNDHSTLIWDGKAYLPLGSTVEGDPASIAAAKRAGITDLLVNVPLNSRAVRDAIEALEANRSRYLVRYSGVAPQAEGFTVDPAGYRMSELDGPKVRRVSLPGADRVFAVFASKRSRLVLSSKMVPVIRDTALIDITVPDESDAVLLLYPQGKSQEVVDLWEGLDRHRDTLLSVLANAKFGDGARGIVNPLGQVSRFPSNNPRFVPTSPMFRREFEAFLQERYRAVLTGARTWSLRSSFVTNSEGDGKSGPKSRLGNFAQLARLIPLWSGTRGIDYFLDPETEELLGCDRQRSAYWKDYSDFVRFHALKRFNAAVMAVKRVADLPVVQEWKNWSPVTDGPESALDGMASSVLGDGPSARLESSVRALSTVRSWSRSGWAVASEVSLGERRLEPIAAAEEATQMGFRAVFLRQQPSDLKPLPSLDPALAQYLPGVLFFPENATNPAQAQRLANGKLWLPCPADGNRIDMGERYFAYRISDRRMTGTVLWAEVPGRVRLRMLKPETATFATIDGSDPNLKIFKGGVDVDLGQLPLVISGTDEVPIPEIAFDEVFTKFQSVFQKARRQPGETIAEAMYFRDGLAAFEKNPAGSFALMRTQFLRLLARGSDYIWVEAENSANHNFSEVGSIASCSNGSALLLNTTLTTEGGYFAEYALDVRSTKDQNVWVAAKIPSDRWQELSIIIGGQVLTPQGPPISFYGNGFGWYKMGTTRLQGNKVTARVQLPSATLDSGIDVILLTPEAFEPRGVAQPEPKITPVRVTPPKPGGTD